MKFLTQKKINCRSFHSVDIKIFEKIHQKNIIIDTFAFLHCKIIKNMQKIRSKNHCHHKKPQKYVRKFYAAKIYICIKNI